jgi:hypothetical protein
MIWNWQLADWSHFIYSASQLGDFEKPFEGYPEFCVTGFN